MNPAQLVFEIGKLHVQLTQAQEALALAQERIAELEAQLKKGADPQP